jgi:hypothetical protein
MAEGHSGGGGSQESEINRGRRLEQEIVPKDMPPVIYFL